MFDQPRVRTAALLPALSLRRSFLPSSVVRNAASRIQSVKRRLQSRARFNRSSVFPVLWWSFPPIRSLIYLDMAPHFFHLPSGLPDIPLRAKLDEHPFPR